MKTELKPMNPNRLKLTYLPTHRYANESGFTREVSQFYNKRIW